MHVSSACQLPVASKLWRPRPGAFALTIVCKATFALRPGTSPLAAVQVNPFEADVAWEDGRGSLRAASDLAPFKRRVDVVVVGHAHAPRGEPVTSLVARVAVGETRKAVEVHGDRWWMPDGSFTKAAPFTRMPLRWERAAGGPGTWNPAGLPESVSPDAAGPRPAPNLTPVGAALRSAIGPIPPAGLGPIAPAWPERSAHLGRHAAVFRHDRWAEQPLPADIDAAYFNVAPADQQANQVRAGERIELEHLHPAHPHLTTALEEVTPLATVRRAGGAPQELQLRCDIVVIDTDAAICTLTWRAIVHLAHPSEEGAVIVTAGPQASDAIPVTARPRSLKRPALPFMPAEAGAPAGEAVDAPASLPAPSSVEAIERQTSRVQVFMEHAPVTVPVVQLVALRGALPFVESPRTPDREPAVSPEDVPVERYAAISAEIAEGRAPRLEVLRAHALDEGAWASVERRWRAALEEEGARRGGRLRAAYDSAYVAAVEGFRGPISLPEYARIAVGQERRRAGDALDALKIQRQALSCILRVWTKKVAADPELAAEAAKLLTRLRQG
ncbi:DUF2169 family type VI secretion system accessory protein [Sorangium sp. So ce204]|uniref:DUF2169 family type VI secretion system accessory protein n=1 Tax=Sorangium sp. So ce204 TaxID=3133288 RepID=UPI003F626071